MDTTPFPITKYQEFAEREKIKFPTAGAIRWHVRNAADNGLEAALVRKGKRILIDPTRFMAWLQQSHTPAKRTTGPALKPRRGLGAT